MIDLYSTNAPHQNKAMALIAQGVSDHTRLLSYKHTAMGDMAVCWGVRLLDQLQSRYKRVVVIERAYFNDRYNYYSMGFDGLNGRADFNNTGMPGDRWAAHGVEMKPWKAGEFYLIMGQVTGDQSVKDVDIEAWYQDVHNELEQKTDKPIFFRPHPQARANQKHLPTMRGDLQKTFERCAGVITYNSNSGVDAVLAGVPVMAHDEGSMAWPVAAHSIDELLQHDALGDRTQWAHNLAYAQWTADELADGTAWHHLVP